jgi:flagellar hook-length control protein FliK
MEFARISCPKKHNFNKVIMIMDLNLINVITQNPLGAKQGQDAASPNMGITGALQNEFNFNNILSASTSTIMNDLFSTDTGNNLPTISTDSLFNLANLGNLSNKEGSQEPQAIDNSKFDPSTTPLIAGYNNIILPNNESDHANLNSEQSVSNISMDDNVVIPAKLQAPIITVVPNNIDHSSSTINNAKENSLQTLLGVAEINKNTTNNNNNKIQIAASNQSKLTLDNFISLQQITTNNQVNTEVNDNLFSKDQTNPIKSDAIDNNLSLNSTASNPYNQNMLLTSPVLAPTTNNVQPLEANASNELIDLPPQEIKLNPDIAAQPKYYSKNEILSDQEVAELFKLGKESSLNKEDDSNKNDHNNITTTRNNFSDLLSNNLPNKANLTISDKSFAAYNLQNNIANLNNDQQVRVSILKATKENDNKISIQLNPSELGRLEIRLDINNSKNNISITADKASTLDMLQRDSRNIERILTDVGIKADASSLSFSLSHGQHQQNQGAQNQFFQNFDFQDQQENIVIEQATSHYNGYYKSSAALDIQV